MKLSIIIPTLNEEKYLPKLLQSIRGQDFKDYEIIVSDGKSKDNTRQIARKSGCKIVAGVGRPGIGRNKGARTAKGKYLLFLDADIILPENFLKQAIIEFEERGLDIAFCSPNPIEDTIGNKLFLEIFNIFNGIAQYAKPFGGGFCLLVKKEMHKKINGFNEDIYYLEDVDYIQRAAGVGRFRVLKPRILISMRRFAIEGRWNSMKRYILTYLYRMAGKEVTGKRAREKKFYYTFDYKKD